MYYRGQKVRHFGLIPDMISSRYGDKTAFIFEDEKQSFKELRNRSNKVANTLTDLGIDPGSHVCLYIPNSMQFPEAFYGVVRAGAIPVPLNLRMPPRTLSFVVENANAKAIIGSDLTTENYNPQKAKELAENEGIENLLIPNESKDNVLDYKKLTEEADSEFDLVPRDYEDTAAMLYTSGTTGKPKGVPLTHKNVIRCIIGSEQSSEAIEENRHLLILPLYHVYGLAVVLGMYLTVGTSIVLQKELDVEEILQNIDDYECTHFAGVPALYRMLWMEYESNPDKYDLSSLELADCAAAPLDQSTRENIKGGWGVRFVEGWGMTETGGAAVSSPGYVPKKAGCIGWPHPPVEMKLVDPVTRETIVPWSTIAPSGDIEESEVDQEGEVAIRGDPVFEGYYKREEKTKEAFDDEGWFYTGDIMRIDEDKAFWMVDRSDDMILSGGENIYPSRVEEALMEHEEITEAGVVPATHKTKGEVPVAFVVLSPDSELTEDEIKEFTLERVPTYAHPRKVFFTDDLPKSASLKTQRFKLEEKVEEKIGETLPLD